MADLDPKTLNFWRKVVDDHHDEPRWRETIARCLAEAEMAKRRLREKGYGHLGKGLLDTVEEVGERWTGDGGRLRRDV